MLETTLHDYNKINKVLSIKYRSLLRKIKKYNPQAKLDRISTAFRFGRKAHDGQLRDSGDPYFIHPISVASLLAEIKVDADTIITALLHDTVEDCGVSLNEIDNIFGKDVRKLVNGVTKLTKLQLQSIDSQQAENFRKLLISMGEDIRVMLIKLADRVHNIQTLEFIKNKERKEKIATETIEIYAPLAEKMGITKFQNELEDKSFAVLQPEMRLSILNRLIFLEEESENIIFNITKKIRNVLNKENIECKVFGRLKSPYSIWRKMKNKKISMEQLSDIMAFRVIVPSNSDCYKCLEIIHRDFPMVMGRFKDYISTPKRNGYMSLHTGVIGPYQKKIEIQIRTFEMHDTSERGVAAHCDYKSNFKEKKKNSRHLSYKWLQELLNLSEINSSANEFLVHTKMEMYKDQVFCFTPRGDLIGLPKGATPIDFAYSVHSKVGDNCAGVKINGKKRQLTTELENGDQVNILTDILASPRVEWEDFVVTGRAKSAIRKFLKQKKQKEFRRIGKLLLQQEYKFRNENYSEKNVVQSLNLFALRTIDELYELIAEGTKSPKEIFEHIYPNMVKTQRFKLKKENNTNNLKKSFFTIDRFDEGMAFHIGKCCYPLPGDKIVGIITTGKGITIHTNNCYSLSKFTELPELWVKVNWLRDKIRKFAGRLKVTLINEPLALSALCTIVGQQNGNIINIQIDERNINFFTFLIDIEVRDIEHIHSIIAILGSNNYVENVERSNL